MHPHLTDPLCDKSDIQVSEMHLKKNITDSFIQKLLSLKVVNIIIDFILGCSDMQNF